MILLFCTPYQILILDARREFEQKLDLAKRELSTKCANLHSIVTKYENFVSGSLDLVASSRRQILEETLMTLIKPSETDKDLDEATALKQARSLIRKEDEKDIKFLEGKSKKKNF